MTVRIRHADGAKGSLAGGARDPSRTTKCRVPTSSNSLEGRRDCEEVPWRRAHFACVGLGFKDSVLNETVFSVMAQNASYDVPKTVASARTVAESRR